MPDIHAIVNTELMHATDNRGDMRSFRFGTGTGETFQTKDIDNGNVVRLGALIEHDLWEAVECAANTALGDIVLVTTPELLYDERQRNRYEFYNEAGSNATGMTLRPGDIFSVTVEALDVTGTPKVGDTVGVQAGTKLKVGGGTKIGKIIDSKVRDKTVFWGILIG